MTHFLETLPLDFSLPATQELQAILTGRYYSSELIVEYLAKTPLSPGDVNLSGSARRIWFSALDTARYQDVLREVVDAARADAAIRGRIDELLESEPVVASPHMPTGAEEEPEDKPWADPDNAIGIERLLAGISTLLPTSFLEKSLMVAPAVARLRTSFDSGDYHGTGFRIGNDVLLTNHHVLHDWKHGNKKAKGVKIWFDYELDATGDLKQVIEVNGDPVSIKGQKEHDWAVIRTKEPMPAKYPILPLGPKKPPQKNDRAYIIQHPQGNLKQIGMHRNLVSYVDADVIQYFTDTDEGSSGSPVFNERWEVVGLHHKWVKLEGVQEGDEIVVYRNQGRRIEMVVAGLNQAGIDLG